MFIITDLVNDPVGQWVFQDLRLNQLIDPNDLNNIQELLKMSQKVLETLESKELLQQISVHINHWSVKDKNRLADSQEELPIWFPLAQANELITEYNRIFTIGEKNPDIFFPWEIEIFGVGIIFDEKGRRCIFPEAIWVNALVSPIEFTISVKTQIDAWMPHDLVGQPQPKTAAYNAPRLEAALREIEQKLGIKPWDDEVTKYAVVKGYQLLNHTDVDGNIIPMVPYYRPTGK